MFNSKSLYSCPLLVFYWIINLSEKEKKIHPIYCAHEDVNLKKIGRSRLCF